MNPFSLDHIFHRSLFHIQRQVMTPNMLLFRGFASQASSTPDSYSQRAPGAIQRTLRIRSPFPRLSKITLPLFAAAVRTGRGNTRRSWAWLELN